MHYLDSLELYARHPGSLRARLLERLSRERLAAFDSCAPQDAEEALGAFVQEVVEDEVYEQDGILWSSDGSTCAIGWFPLEGRWVEWDEICYQMSEAGLDVADFIAGAGPVVGEPL